MEARRCLSVLAVEYSAPFNMVFNLGFYNCSRVYHCWACSVGPYEHQTDMSLLDLFFLKIILD